MDMYLYNQLCERLKRLAKCVQRNNYIIRIMCGPEKGLFVRPLYG